MYDGQRSRVNLGLIEWARTRNIMCFVLPAHTSHILQLMDIGCLRAVRKDLQQHFCHKFMRVSCGRSITKFDVCKLGSEAYLKALSTENLQSTYRKAEIYPFNSNAVNPANFLTATALEQEKPADIPPTETSAVTTNPPVDTESLAFFEAKEKTLTEKKPATKKRNYLSFQISGKAITEENMVEVI